MSTKTFTATSSNGTTFTRTSKTMDYKFCVMGRFIGTFQDRNINGRIVRNIVMDQNPRTDVGPLGWSQCRDNAQKMVSRWSGILADVEIVAVSVAG